MKKIFVVACAYLLLAATPVFAQYQYGYGMMGYNWGAFGWLLMVILGLIWFIIASYIFAWIFWMVGSRMVEKKMGEKGRWKMGEGGSKEESPKTQTAK